MEEEADPIEKGKITSTVLIKYISNKHRERKEAENHCPEVNNV